MSASNLNLRDDLAALRIDRSRVARPSRLRTVLGGCLVAGLLAGGAFALFAVFRDRILPLPEVRTETVRVMALSRADTVLTATGYLESRAQAAVGAKSPGRVARRTGEWTTGRPSAPAASGSAQPAGSERPFASCACLPWKRRPISLRRSNVL